MAKFKNDEGDHNKMALPSNGTRRGGELFATKKEFENFIVDWPGKRLVEFWNGIPGVKPVRKFTNRKTAIDRIWNAHQQSRSKPAVSTAGAECADKPKESHKTNDRTGIAMRARRAKTVSKTAAILKLLRQPSGVTLEKLMRVTRWQAHSVRGFISAGVNKRMGFRVTSKRRQDGQRVYQIR
jgi:uncharacterized protein DUF3489